jgi:hypothetical protein
VQSRFRIPVRWVVVSIVSICVFAADGLASRSATPESAPDPLALYGEEIYFDVYRKGDRVGFHRVRFQGDRRDLTVRSEFRLQIDVLYLTVFRYDYRSEARWRRGKLDRLRVTLDDDGERSTLDASRVGDGLKVRYDDGSYLAALPLFPTNHWNAGVLEQDRVLNTLTGRLNAVRITPAGREAVATENGEIAATRYIYSGDLETEAWYDDAGRWVKMRFKGRDGSTIEYVCRRCQGEMSRRVAQ